MADVLIVAIAVIGVLLTIGMLMCDDFSEFVQCVRELFGMNDNKNEDNYR